MQPILLPDIRCFLNHLQQHFSEYCCQICALMLASKFALFIHIQKKHKAPQKTTPKVGPPEGKTRRNSFICAHCGVIRFSKDQLYNHIQKMHFRLDTDTEKSFLNIGPPEGKTHCNSFICAHCGVTRFSKDQLHNHIQKMHFCLDAITEKSLKREWTSPNSFTCDHCGVTQSSKDQLHSHIQEMHFHFDTVSEKSLDCERECLNDAHKLLQHIATPSNVKSSVENCELPKKIIGLLPSKDKKRVFPLPNQPIRRLPQYRQYLMKHFPTHQTLFPCSQCDLPRSADLEIIKSPADGFACRQCTKTSYLDVSCHIHATETGLLCGFCLLGLKQEDIKEHIEGHWFDHSYLTNICSMGCLKSLFKSWPKTVKGIKRRYNCYVCFQSMSSLTIVKDHILKLHRPTSEWLKCNECEFLAGGTGQLRSHKNRVHLNKPRRKTITKTNRMKRHCIFCSFGYDSVPRLKRHLESAHRKQELVCPECNNVFPDLADFVSHLEIHFSKYKCGVTGCCTVCASEVQLKNHLEFHAALFSCFVCGETFADKDQRQTHASHCQKRFVCAHCGWYSLDKFKLADHINKSHFSLDKNMKCKSCPESFSSFIQLMAHRAKAHKRERVCDICGVVKSDGNSMSQHKLYHHSDVRPFLCNECGKTFKLKHHLTQHIYYNHTKDSPFSCEHCGNKFRRESNLKDHVAKACKVVKKTGK